jgi:hypothetical protein
MSGTLDIWDVPYVFDVILADFGRSATLRLLNSVAERERSEIQRILSSAGRPAEFLDEYRRIMFACVGDLAYIKRDLIEPVARAGGYLGHSVLFGVNSTKISPEQVEAIATVLTGPLRDAISRGYTKLRVVIPCNTLASVEQQLVELLAKTFHDFDVMLSGAVFEAAPSRGSVTVYSVPRVVLEHVDAVRYMLIGTELSRAIYSDVIRELKGPVAEVLPISAEQQEIMNRLVVASIGGDKAEIARCNSDLERRVLRPLDASNKDSVVIQASTDLDLSGGHNSLRLFADQLVDDCYPG